MRKIVTSFLLYVAFGGALMAQNSLKFYTSLRFDNQETTVSRFGQEDTIRMVTNKSANVGGFIPAFSLGSENGSFLEFAITNFRFNKTNDISLLAGASHAIPGSTTNAAFGVRVEYAYSLLEASGIRLMAGAAVNPVYETKQLKPESSYFYDTRHTDFTFNFDLVPRIQVDLSDALFLDLHLPITILEWSKNSVKYDSSVVPSAPFTETGSTTTILPRRVLIRVGLGVRF